MEQNQAKTIIAEDIEIVGSIKCASNIQLSGKLNGDLNCSGNAVIGETATIKGNISANSTTILGQVNGNVSVKDRIELKSSARLNGDIRAKRLTVEDGVTFVGKSEVNPAGSGARAAGSEEKTGQAPADTEEKPAGDDKNGKGIFNRKN